MAPPQLTAAIFPPVNFAADVPVFPPFATLCIVFLAVICSTIKPIPLVKGWHYPLFVRVVVLAIGVGLVGALLKNAGGELKKAGSGVGFTPVGGLATGGLYQYTRNPMYSGLVFFVLPWFCLVLNSAWPFILSPILWLYLNNVVIAAEEKLLLTEFGDEFKKFCGEAPRWLL